MITKEERIEGKKYIDSQVLAELNAMKRNSEDYKQNWLDYPSDSKQFLKIQERAWKLYYADLEGLGSE